MSDGSNNEPHIVKLRSSRPPRPKLNRVLVYGSASTQIDPRFIELGEQTGALLAKAGCKVVYGGGNLGMMGAVANGALNAGGHVTGVIPGFLKEAEIMHIGVQDLRVVDDMHERKRLMFDLSDAIVALPGGYGTVEEFFEVATWKQIGRHDKPIVVANFLDYWQPMIDFVEHMNVHKFLHHRADTFDVTDTPEGIMKLLGLTAYWQDATVGPMSEPNWNSISGDQMGPRLRGLGLNLLVRDVERAAHFLSQVMDAAIFQPTKDFAIVKVSGTILQLHADATYHSNPLLGLLPETPPRGAGIELRLYDVDPEAAHKRAVELGYEILQPPTDKSATHGLLEAYILDDDGYCWVPSRPLVEVI